MGIPLLDIIQRLGLGALVPLAIVGVVLLYFLVRDEVQGLIFFLATAAAFTGSATSMIADMASLVRWIIVVLLPLPGIIFGNRLRVSFGILLFWSYVLCGLISLLNASLPIWQVQRGILLLAVALALPLAFSSRNYRVFRSSILAIALAAALFCIVNFAALPGSLTSAERFSGYSSKAPNFALTVSALLPFTFWGLWKARALVIKLISGAGFLLGTVILIYSGQRTGTLGGLLGIAPLALAALGSKRLGAIKWPVLSFCALLVIGYTVFQASDPGHINFLISRYSLQAGLSNRELIWREAFGQIGAGPILGHGIGASEMLVSSSLHNAYLEIWYNAGIPGLFFFIASQLYIFYKILVLRSHNQDAEIRSVLLLALGYMLSFVFMSLFESIGAQASGVNMLLYLFLATLVCDEELFKRARPENAYVRSEVPAEAHGAAQGQPS